MSNNIRILFLVSDTEFGGGEQYFFSIVNGLVAEQYEFTIGCKPGTSLQSYVSEKEYNYIPFMVSKRTDFSKMLRFSKTIRNNYDIILLGDSKAWNTGYFISKYSKAQKICAIVHMTHIGLEQKEYGKTELYLSSWWDRLWSRYCDFIIVSNEKNAQILENEGIKRAKLKVMPNCIDVEKLNSEKYTNKEEVLERHSISPDKRIIGTLARLGPGKDYKTLFDSIEIIVNSRKDYHFLIVGKGPFKDTLELDVKRRELDNYITFTGWVDDAYEYLNSFDVFLFSSISEGIPYVILEAMAFGKAIVATNNGAVSEAILDGETGILVEKQNPEKLTQDLLKVLESEKLADDLGRKARNFVKEKFSLNLMLNNFDNFFKQIAGN